MTPTTVFDFHSAGPQRPSQHEAVCAAGWTSKTAGTTRRGILTICTAEWRNVAR